MGYYRTKCHHETNDGICVNCTNKPTGNTSFYVSSGVPFDENNCSWVCTGPYWRNGSECSPCSVTTCPAGLYRGDCNIEYDAPCIPCTNPIPLNASYSTGGVPFDQDECGWQCNPGFFWDGTKCKSCTTAPCPYKEFRTACGNDTDSTCLPCPEQGNPLEGVLPLSASMAPEIPKFDVV